MDPVFKKMNYKAQPTIAVLQAPASFEPSLQQMRVLTSITTSTEDLKPIGFALVFVTMQEEVDRFAKLLDASLEGDALLWMAYPKGTSKKYTCDFNRDTGWAVLGQLGYESVRQVAIDEDWSALRFRRAAYIKTMKRDEKRAMSEEGKKKRNP